MQAKKESVALALFMVYAKEKIQKGEKRVGTGGLRVYRSSARSVCFWI